MSLCSRIVFNAADHPAEQVIFRGRQRKCSAKNTSMGYVCVTDQKPP